MIRVLGKDSGSNFALSGEGDNTSGPLHGGRTAHLP